jgi:HSP20 family protein
MKTQQALEAKPPDSPVFVEAEKLIERMEDAARSVARRAYDFFEQRGRRIGFELDDWFRAESEVMRPVPVTMKENETQIIVQAEVPGFKAEEVKISAEPKRLIIEGSSTQTTEQKSEEVVFSERRANQFCRSISLPAEVDTGSVTASLKDGVLEVTLPKAPVRQPVGVEVKAG